MHFQPGGTRWVSAPPSTGPFLELNQAAGSSPRPVAWQQFAVAAALPTGEASRPLPSSGNLPGCIFRAPTRRGAAARRPPQQPTPMLQLPSSIRTAPGPSVTGATGSKPVTSPYPILYGPAQAGTAAVYCLGANVLHLTVAHSPSPPPPQVIPQLRCKPGLAQPVLSLLTG